MQYEIPCCSLIIGDVAMLSVSAMMPIVLYFILLHVYQGVLKPTNKEIEALEMVQNKGVRMICGLKGRRGVTEAKEKLQLQQLDICQTNSCIKLLLKTLPREDDHPAICSSYDDIINLSQTTVQTRSQSRNEPRSTATT